MGLFDRLANKDEALSPRAAMLLAAITMVAADGSIDDEELHVIRRLDRANDGSWDQAVRAWKVGTFDSCIDLATEALDERQRLVTLANLVDIAMADGLLARQEKELLEVYVDRFDLDPDSVSTLVDVIAVKNDESAFA